MTTIATWLGNTLESARRIRFEPTADIPATEVQTAIEQAFAGGGSGGGLTPLVTPYVTPPASAAIPATAVVVQTNQSSPLAITVPDSEAWHVINGGYGIPLTIFDKSGNASTNNVTITFTGGQTASGVASLTISSDYGGWALERKEGGGWIIV